MAGGHENLIPQNMRTKEEQRAVATMGGKASGETRRKQKTLREHFEAFGKAKPNPVVVEQFRKLGLEVGPDDTMLDCMFKWAGVKTVERSTKMGDLLKFFEVFGRYTGQEPAQKHELSGVDGQPIQAVKYVTSQSIDEIKKHIKDVIDD